jgi:hypothetical protein
MSRSARDAFPAAVVYIAVTLAGKNEQEETRVSFRGEQSAGAADHRLSVRPLIMIEKAIALDNGYPATR